MVCFLGDGYHQPCGWAFHLSSVTTIYNLGLGAELCAHFMCLHELHPTSEYHLFSFRNISLAMFGETLPEKKLFLCLKFSSELLPFYISFVIYAVLFLSFFPTFLCLCLLLQHMALFQHRGLVNFDFYIMYRLWLHGLYRSLCPRKMKLDHPLMHVHVYYIFQLT